MMYGDRFERDAPIPKEADYRAGSQTDYFSNQRRNDYQTGELNSGTTRRSLNDDFSLYGYESPNPLAPKVNSEFNSFDAVNDPASGIRQVGQTTAGPASIGHLEMSPRGIGKGSTRTNQPWAPKGRKG